ncbi:MAG TPA: hypothetical protein DEP85_06790, partial [Holosporales bacterium]|nr:hypothetical protein [Holosporales bacterium]
MSIKVEFKKPTTAQVVCLGVYEGNQLPEPTLKWDKKLKGLLSESLKKSRFKGKFNQSLTVFSQDGTQFILIGLGKTSDLNETQWTKIGGAIAHA